MLCCRDDSKSAFYSSISVVSFCGASRPPLVVLLVGILNKTICSLGMNLKEVVAIPGCDSRRVTRRVLLHTSELGLKFPHYDRRVCTDNEAVSIVAFITTNQSTVGMAVIIKRTKGISSVLGNKTAQA